MISSITRILVAAVLAVRFVVADFTVDTPKLVQCQTTTVNWNGGNPNYLLFVVPANDVCADSVVNIPQTGQNNLPWKVTLAAGSKVELMVADADGSEAWSGTMTVQPSNDTSCIDNTAMKALAASGSGPVNASSNAAPDVKSPTPTLSSLSGYTAAPVSPSIPSGAVGNAGSDPSASAAAAISGAVPRAAFPAGSIFAVAVILFNLAHL